MLPVSAPAQLPFYQDNNKIIVAATPGGTGDFRVRGIERLRLPQGIREDRRRWGRSDHAGSVGKVVKETPRDAEVIDTLKKLSGAGPLPTR
jgi:hypothetical protein